MDDESRAEFSRLLRGFVEHFQPMGTFECYLVGRLASIAWRLRRLAVGEVRHLNAGKASANFAAQLSPPFVIPLELLTRYEGGLGREFDRTLQQLERAQRRHREKSSIDIDEEKSKLRNELEQR